VVEHDWVQLNLHSDVWLDVEVFERASAATQDVPGRLLERRDAVLLHDAILLYKSDLLDGWYQDWCLFERERLQNIYLCMLDKLMSYCEAHADYEAGQRYGAMILRYDRASERTHRRLMHLQYQGGDRTGALRQYQRCVAALNDELGVKPERRTKNLYELIRNDEFRPQDADSTSTTSATPVALPEVLGRLKRLQLVLAALQKRVGRDVKAVEEGIETMRR
jgi:DNA-binding SARP family transcriptional activator